MGGLDFLIIHIEIDWPTYAVTWADKIIKRYPNRRVILSTHAFLEHVERAPDESRSSAAPTAACRPKRCGSSSIKPNCNVFMVINGHTLVKDDGPT